MTYDEGITWLQDTLEGRETLGLWKTNLLNQKYSSVARRMTREEFVAKRNNQMRRLYGQYIMEKNGTRPIFFLAGETDVRKMKQILGDEILIDSTDASFIHELVEINGSTGSFPENKVAEVVENMTALKACLEKTTGTKVLTIPLCKETRAMRNEMKISSNVYDRDAYEASLKDRAPRSEIVSKIFSALKSMSRHPGEPEKLGDQQMPQIEEK